MATEGSLKFAPSSDARQDAVLRDIATAVEELGNREGWDESLVFRVNLVLDELASNILLHGREEGRWTPGIEIRILSGDEELTIEVSDDGRPFDPFRDAPEPGIDESVELVPVGGLGVHLVKNMVDSMFYRHEDGRNRITMTARRTQTAP